MALPNLFKNAQSQSGIQVVPVSFTYLEAGGYGDDAAPGRWFPLLSDVDGALFVTVVGPGGLPIMLPDDADSVAEVATNTRIPTVARMYGFDQGGTFSRIRTDDDSDISSAADGLPTLRVMGRNRLFIDSAGPAWEVEHGNDGVSVAASASRTVTTTFGTFVNVNHRALHVIVGVTVIGADTLTIEIQGRQLFPPFSFYPLLISAAISSTGTTVLKVGIGFSPILNLTANDMVPYVWQVVATPSGVDPITYSINANLSV